MCINHAQSGHSQFIANEKKKIINGKEKISVSCGCQHAGCSTLEAHFKGRTPLTLLIRMPDVEAIFNLAVPAIWPHVPTSRAAGQHGLHATQPPALTAPRDLFRARPADSHFAVQCLCWRFCKELPPPSSLGFVSGAHEEVVPVLKQSNLALVQVMSS